MKEIDMKDKDYLVTEKGDITWVYKNAPAQEERTNYTLQLAH